MGADSKWIYYTRKDTYEDYLWAAVFFFSTAYLFVGIAIASDLFMSAIEKICGATRVVTISKEEDGVVVVTHKEVLIWNETVANLTLMALGSSAPEILLSVIEISEGLGSQDSGDLGPGTIVGSAAFNLMVISALCILSMGDGRTSRIKLYNVFAITCATSLFAYIWMVIVLQWVTPDQVDLWEAILTLIYSPLLVLISYWADQDFCMSGRNKRQSIISHVSAKSKGDDRDFYFGDKDEDNLYDDDGNVDKEALKNLYEKLQAIAVLSPEEIVTILATKLQQGKRHTPNWYRTKAFRTLLGSGTGSGPSLMDEKLQEVVNALGDTHPLSADPKGVPSVLLKSTITSQDVYMKKAVVEFQAAALAVPEAVGTFSVIINRTGRDDLSFYVHVESLDGTAKAGQEYIAVSETIYFDPHIKEQTVNVSIIDNSVWNPDTTFYLKLSVVEESQEKAIAGQMRVIQIIIQDDDKPGKLSFTKQGYLFKEFKKVVYVDVLRTDGTDGTIKVKWKVHPGPKCTLVTSDVEGTLQFDVGEMKKAIEIRCHPHEGKIRGEEEVFEVELYEPQGGAKLGKFRKATCALSSDHAFKLEINNVITAAIQQSEEADEEVSYKDQIIQSIYPNDGDVKNATVQQWILHVIVFPFKLIMSFIPPPHMCGGWLCFILALISVGFLTKLVGETAGSFGASLKIDPVLTAITFVALGTSLPDTFASMIAAKNDKTADNAIGNVTGSNSVNVFLGLGLPWTIGAIYYKLTKYDGQEQPFCVLAGSLTFNVVIFSLLAFVTIAILIFRRFSPLCGQAELGGPTVTKWITEVLLICMWGMYILLAAVQIYWAQHIADPFTGGVKKTKCRAIVTTKKLLEKLRKN